MPYVRAQRMKVNLSDFRFNHYSQCGEDGVVAALLKMCRITTGHLVEFGAWDGLYLSNTAHHYKEKDHNFKLLLIEGDTDKFNGISANFGDEVQKCNAMISANAGDSNNINEILGRYDVEDIALMSIDVDGPDLLIWQSMDKKKYAPKILIIEWGVVDSVLSEEFLPHFDGYTYVYCTGNHIFCRNDLGIKQPMSVLELLNASGHPEIDMALGNITKEECHRIVRTEEFKHYNYYTTVAKPVWVEIETK